MGDTIQIILGSTVATTIMTSIIAYLFHKRTERANAEIKREFEIRSQIHNSDFIWKQKTTELLGQVYIHLNRTRLSFERYYSSLKACDSFYEDEILYTSNKHVRDMLLENGHYLPPELLGEASKLIEHYDAWLVKYNKIRKVNKDNSLAQIYVGPDGFEFPKEAEQLFKKKYIELFNTIRQVQGFDK